MAMLPQTFNALDFDPTQGMSQLPLSDKTGHKMIITDTEIKAGSSTGSSYIKAIVQIIEGPHTGAEGSFNLTLTNDNEQAVQIGQRQMSALCHVINTFQVSDTADLHNKPFRGVVTKQKVKAGAEDKGYTELSRFLDVDGNEPSKAGSGARAPQPAAQPAPAAPQQPIQQQPVAPAAAPAQPAWGAPAAQTAPVQPTAPAAPSAPAQGQMPATPPWGQQ